ncbi:telomerase reverse transcriptase, putative [Trypanosoma cruzi]|uniref:Telomerase reverse transcriptase n=1 Tax=Trypanosoma cruzi (strain CL Brener) TaxID=353153 RepID=Q4D161_TRYCC|nr:telomerase reverse transcriptase, putative [Trypanosoma cruzi]EAN86265.1 telomerase reverse transcriptase, putative [Trypanosoma cruzi]|eukprot:XP_808116.1 telomerase reverse transcriptase [Trypanosoma cruzi strain CL Brener]
MSSTFPIVPGYDGPWSLKDFLQRYFFVRLRFEASPPTCFVPPNNERVLFVRPTGGFAVVMYASLSAPPPPPPPPPAPLLVTTGEGEFASKGHDLLPRAASLTPHGRPLTSSLLRLPFWNSLFTQLGPAAVSFILAWCPVVVQFEPNGGGLQVLGPPLKNAVPRAVNRQRGPGWTGSRKMGRYERNAQHRILRGSSSESLMSSLYRLNVSRLPLIGEAPLCTFAEIDRRVNPRLSKLWREHHGGMGAAPSSCRCSVTAGAVPMPCADACSVLAVSRELVHLVFPYTLSINVDEDNTVKMASVERHLTHVLHCVLSGVCKMNFRGAAIKHTGFLEERSLSFNHVRPRGEAGACAAVPVSELTVPETIMTSYLRSLLGGIWWRAPQATERVSFWGEALVLERLCAITLSWLQCGRHENFPLSHFLHQMPVAKLPWLRGFYTRGSGRRRRSMIQQRVLLQFFFFLFQHVVPFLVRSSFHVTWSSKKPNAFLFIPKSVWIRLVSRELRQVCLRRRRRTKRERDGDGAPQPMALPPMALERLTSEKIVGLKMPPGKDAVPAVTTAPPLLYSSIRFLLDQRKLRPIARVRFANARWLLKMADGLCSPATPSVCNVSGRAVASTNRTKRSSAVSPNATVLRGALRCLLAGLAEQCVGSSLVKFTNISHQDEYAEVRSFVEGARRFFHHPLLASTLVPSAAPVESSAVVTMVRGDAARCYDCLPQEAVMNTVRRLLPHEFYHTLSFTAVAPLTDGRGTATVEGVGVQGWKTAEEDAPSVGVLLHRRVKLQTVSGKCVQNGTLPGIPKGWIMYEEPIPPSESVMRGDEMRTVLGQHLQKHLVVIEGRLYSQGVGITQGSAVAMLLCDILLETVDHSLSNILSQHEEPALLLRRVDDVLVVTLSPVAAARCDAALRHGWPEVGFFCQDEKLRCTTVALIPWCGLLWNPQTLEFSVEWRRLSSLLPHIASRPMTGNEPLHCSLRLMSILCLRTPLTVLCRRINTKTRVVQTLCEIGFLWSRFFLKKLLQNAMFIRPHVRVLLRPLALAIASLCRLIRRQKGYLERLGSFCDVTDEEIRLCVLFTLHHTLQEWLPRMISQIRRRREGLKQFFLLISALVRRKMRAALLMDGAPCEGDDEHIAASRGGSHGVAAAAAAINKYDDVGKLLLAEGDDTVIVRALAAVRFPLSRAFTHGGNLWRLSEDSTGKIAK